MTGRTADTERVIGDDRTRRSTTIAGREWAPDTVSRIPVREALKSMATSGLLEHTVNSGFTMSQLDESELVQIYWLRNGPSGPRGLPA